MVSVLFNEPKLLKSNADQNVLVIVDGFSALQRAEIAEIAHSRAPTVLMSTSFSALQRAEIAEMRAGGGAGNADRRRFSALQRAEIAEIRRRREKIGDVRGFQCSSTSRNC